MYLLRQGFYTIYSRNKSEDELTVNMQFNFDHKIFEGHFPDQPVVPGVCMLQIIKEQVAEFLHTPLILESTGQLKFLSSIIPDQADFYTFNILFKENTDSYIKVDASIKTGANTYFKGILSFKK